MKLQRWADSLGVRIVEGDLPGDACGLYDDRLRVIFLDSNLGAIQHRSTLAHELGHAFYRHSGTKPRWEAQASEWAAQQLIDHDQFMTALNIFDGSVAIANELGVLPRDVDNYADWWSKNLCRTLKPGHSKWGAKGQKPLLTLSAERVS